MSATSQNIASQQSDKQDEWFDAMINSLKVDQIQIQTRTAPEEKERLYNSLIDGEPKEIISEMRNKSSQYFIEKVVKEFLSELNRRNVTTNQLAFDLSDAKVLVWAEIEDFDETSEDGLILSEAKVNSHFSDFGFQISSTIIEKSDNLPVPPHYASIKN